MTVFRGDPEWSGWWWVRGLKIQSDVIRYLHCNLPSHNNYLYGGFPVTQALQYQ